MGLLHTDLWEVYPPVFWIALVSYGTLSALIAVGVALSGSSSPIRVPEMLPLYVVLGVPFGLYVTAAVPVALCVSVALWLGTLDRWDERAEPP